MFQTVFRPSTGAQNLHIQRQVFVRTLLLPAASLARLAAGSSTIYTGRVIMFSAITNIYNKKTKGPTLMELFTAAGKLKKFFFDN